MKAGSRDQIILEPTSELQTFWWFIGVVGAIFTVGGLFGLSDPVMSPALDLSIAGAGAVAAFLGFTFVSQTQEYYILDMPTQEVLFCRVFYGKESRKLVAKFADLHCVSIAAHRQESTSGDGRVSVSWNHTLELVTRQAQRIVVGDATDFSCLPPRAEELATLLDLKVVPEPKEKKYLLVQPGLPLRVSYEEYTDHGRRVNLGAGAFIGVIILIVVVIAMATMKGWI